MGVRERLVGRNRTRKGRRGWEERNGEAAWGAENWKKVWGAPCAPRLQPTPVMLRMLSAMAVGVPVPAVVSACRTRIMASSLCSVFFRHERHTGSLLDTCREARQYPASLQPGNSPLSPLAQLSSTTFIVILGQPPSPWPPSPSALSTTQLPPRCLPAESLSGAPPYPPAKYKVTWPYLAIPSHTHSHRCHMAERVNPTQKALCSFLLC